MNSFILLACSILADKFGRRWPLIIDIILFSVINLASGFAPDLQVRFGFLSSPVGRLNNFFLVQQTFIGLRAVFGIAMGGEWVSPQLSSICIAVECSRLWVTNTDLVCLGSWCKPGA